MNLFTKQKNRLTDLANELTVEVGEGWGEQIGSWGWHVHSAIFKMDSQQGPTVQQRELCSILCGSLDERGVWGRKDTSICMAESLCCSPETIPTLCVNWLYSSIKLKALKKKKKYWGHKHLGKWKLCVESRLFHLFNTPSINWKTLVSCQDHVKPELWSGKRMAASQARGMEVSTVHPKGCHSKASCHHWIGPGGFNSRRVGSFSPVYVLFIFIFIHM